MKLKKRKWKKLDGKEEKGRGGGKQRLQLYKLVAGDEIGLL